ncbi:MAG: GNAT family N-acetyltransferase [Alphaproteobacteria bacterium]|nr:GNAT family N-acetyltransferase [Alphaproteobacteria bacterium]
MTEIGGGQGTAGPADNAATRSARWLGSETMRAAIKGLLPRFLSAPPAPSLPAPPAPPPALPAPDPAAAARTPLPYPAEEVERASLPSGQSVILRPIRPEDAPAHRAFLERLSEEDIRFRFFGQMGELSGAFLERLTRIDYRREMAFIATTPASKPGVREETLGVVRLAILPDGRSGEFAIIVRSDLKGQGLGWLLMQKMIGWARRRALRRIVGHILAENRAMLDFVRRLGFRLRHSEEDASIIEAQLDLAPAMQGTHAMPDLSHLPTRITTAEADAAPLPPGRRSAELLVSPGIELRWYRPPQPDPQTPHDRDEVYIVARGSGRFRRGDVVVTFGPGDCLFAAAHEEHRFEDASPDLAVWVVFGGPPR